VSKVKARKNKKTTLINQVPLGFCALFIHVAKGEVSGPNQKGVTDNLLVTVSFVPSFRLFSRDAPRKRSEKNLRRFCCCCLCYCCQTTIKGAQSRYCELFWPRTKLPLK